MRLKEYFTDKELSCRCGCGAMPKREAIEMLYALRIRYGKPIRIRSAARCPKHNKKEGGKSRSRHITQWKKIRGILQLVKRGDAFDIETTMKSEGILLKAALWVGFRGIGIKDNDFLHLDLRRDLRVWTY